MSIFCPRPSVTGIPAKKDRHDNKSLAPVIDDADVQERMRHHLASVNKQVSDAMISAVIHGHESCKTRYVDPTIVEQNAKQKCAKRWDTLASLATTELWRRIYDAHTLALIDLKVCDPRPTTIPSNGTI